MQTFIDKYIEQGIQQGIQEGIQKGIQEGTEVGRRQGEALVLLGQLRHKFGEPPADVVGHIARADDERLLLWSMRLLDARSLEDVFAGPDAG